MDPVWNIVEKAYTYGVPAVGNAIYYGFDAAGRITKDFNAATQTVKIAALAIDFLNRDLKGDDRYLLPLVATLKIITGFQPVRNWVDNVVFIASGEAAGGTDNTRKIYIDGEPFPNILRLSCICCFAAANILNTLKWLDNLEILNLAKLSEAIGNIPLLGAQVIGFTLKNVVDSFIVFVVVGLVLDLYDTTRDIYQNGLTWFNGVQVVGDLTKLTGIALMTATGHLYVVGLVANAAGCACFLTRFLLKSYRVGGAPVGAAGPQ